LTRKLLNPSLPTYLHSILPTSTDFITSWLVRLGLDAAFKSLEEVEASYPLISSPITVSSSHTKHALEGLHPNICVFRHPDHLPDAQVLQSNLLNSLQNLNLTAAAASKLPGTALSALYGVHEDSVLYWAHHEKLCLVDDRVAFMGGLDLCYGRWDTNQHSIADAHPGDLDRIIFPGQDYNNARIMDFHDVVHWQNNKLDRTKSGRMGWTDVSLCLSGPIIEDLKAHFVERWNFIYDEKYVTRKDTRYQRLTYVPSTAGVVGEYTHPHHLRQRHSLFHEEAQGNQYAPVKTGDFRGDDDYSSARGFGGGGQQGGQKQSHFHEGGFGDRIKDRLEEKLHRYEDKFEDAISYGERPPATGPRGGTVCQLTRSAAKWSHGTKIEVRQMNNVIDIGSYLLSKHSIATAYINVIQNSQHFIYIENQFFITATSDAQTPIKNRIGGAIAERIIRAARAGERYKVFVMMPAVPAFAGDLRSDDSLATRAIMEFQYNSINRGGYSIMETIAKEGYDPMEYIRFYNLRSYDRINSSVAMRDVEEKSGVKYEDARQQFDEKFGGGYAQKVENADPRRSGPVELPGSYGQAETRGYGQAPSYDHPDAYNQYQHAAQEIGKKGGLRSGSWDSVAECYMLGGEDIRNVPWENGAVEEIDAFVSEELYIHSKVSLGPAARRPRKNADIFYSF
jgi:phospholipase D1/2